MFKKLILALLVVVLGFASGGVAHADPTPQQPAKHRISQGEARSVARYAIAHFLYSGLALEDRHMRVSPCQGGPRVWRCPSLVSNKTTKCTLEVWVWAPTQFSYFYEWHDLECIQR